MLRRPYDSLLLFPCYRDAKEYQIPGFVLSNTSVLAHFRKCERSSTEEVTSNYLFIIIQQPTSNVSVVTVVCGTNFQTITLHKLLYPNKFIVPCAWKRSLM